MAVQTNRYYNDPALGQAFSNLAQIFAPATPQDILATTTARAKQAQEARLAELYQRAGNRDIDELVLDRQAGIAGAYSPAASFTAVRLKDATDRRGQDVAAATSRANNAENNRTDVVKAVVAPIAEGSVRPELPPSIAESYRLPSVPAARGAMKVNEGQRVFLPPEPGAAPGAAPPVLEGRDKPLSETEWKAALGREAVARGLIKDADIAAIVMGNTPTQNVVGPDGRGRVAYTAQAVGQEPFTPQTGRPSNAQYVTKSGATGPAVQGADGAWRDAQTGNRLPNDVRITDFAKPQGGNAEIGLPVSTTSNQTDATKRAAELVRTRDLLGQYDELLAKYPGTIGVVGKVRGFTQDAVQATREAAAAFSDDPAKFEGMLRTAEESAKIKGFDPNITRAEFLRRVLAYRLSKTEDSSGEVAMKELVDNEAVLGGGIMATAASVRPKLAEFRRMLDAEERAIGVLRRPGEPDPRIRGGGNTTATPPATKKFIRDANGNLVRVE